MVRDDHDAAEAHEAVCVVMTVSGLKIHIAACDRRCSATAVGTLAGGSASGGCADCESVSSGQ